MSRIRIAHPDDAPAVQAIYAPIVEQTAISFELEPPTVDEIRRRMVYTLETFPWLVHLDAAGAVNAYVYASRYRERAAYQWSVDVSAYVRADSRGQGLAKRLYERLFADLVALGCCQALAGITLPNAGSVALHRSVGFEQLCVTRRVGHKLGAWHDVSLWQRPLQDLAQPLPLRAFNGGRHAG